MASNKIIRLSPSFWRFSLKPIAKYKFHDISTEKELLDYTQHHLSADKCLCAWLDNLLDRPIGYHSKLSDIKLNSKSKRILLYTAYILVGSVVRNDTGLKGGISPIRDFSYSNKSTSNCNINYTLPSSANIINYNPLAHQFLYNSRDFHKDTFRIPICNLPRINYADINWSYLTKVASMLFKNHQSESLSYYSENNRINIFAVDFFISKNTILPFEVHIPGRGIGLHFLAVYEAIKEYREVINSTLESMATFCHSELGPLELMTKDSGHHSTFHYLDTLFSQVFAKKIGLCSGDSSELHRSRITVDFDLPKDTSHEKLARRNLFQEVMSIPTFEIPDNNSLDFFIGDYDNKKFGPWVIAKQSLNYPWWHKNRHKPQILLIGANRSISILKNMISKCPIIIQPLILDSVDNFGHCGELRTYFLSVS